MDISIKMEELIKKYSEQAEKCLEILKSIEMNCEFIKEEKHKGSPYTNNLFNIIVKRGNKSIEFEFHDSIANNRKNESIQRKLIRERRKYFRMAFPKNTKEELDNLLYGVLCCIKMDGQGDYMDFEDFCFEFGCNSDSIKDKQLYDDCCKQRKKIRSIFRLEELETFPN